MSASTSESNVAPALDVALLTGGADKPYAYGLSTELIAKGVGLDLIANDELDLPEFHGKAGVNFLNLRGDQRSNAGTLSKITRVLGYYAKLIGYAVRSKKKLFHILWNNKFEAFDRTLLMVLYISLGKRIVLTIHNVNAKVRDSNDTFLNRLTLRIQYALSDRMFVHTNKMKAELMEGFGVDEARISVIPFGINNAVPNSPLCRAEARQRLGVASHEKALLFFGNITPYKGLEYLVAAFKEISGSHPDYKLIVAGRPKNCESYWKPLREQLQADVQQGRVLLNASFIPDNETEIYFKAADALMLPYTHIYQSGVLFLGYSFGLPVLASDVGALKEEIIEGETGFVFKPGDPSDLAKTIERYFSSNLFAELDERRQGIRDFALKNHSWDIVGQKTIQVYASLLGVPSISESLSGRVSGSPIDAKSSS